MSGSGFVLYYRRTSLFGSDSSIDNSLHGLRAQRRRRLNSRSSRGEKIRTAAGTRRIDALLIDGLLGRLGSRSGRGDATVPSDGVKRAPGAEVEHGNVLIDVERKHRLPEQVCHYVVTGEAAHRAGKLAGHHCGVHA